jgi:hypothetical protein
MDCGLVGSGIRRVSDQTRSRRCACAIPESMTFGTVSREQRSECSHLWLSGSDLPRSPDGVRAAKLPVVVGRVATMSGARTSLFVPDLDRLFVVARSGPFGFVPLQRSRSSSLRPER